MNWPAPPQPTTDPPLVRLARRWWWVPIAVIGAVVFVVVELSDPQDDVHPGIVDMVDTLAAQGDCKSLQEAFDRSDDPGELSYIDAALERTGCYD